MTKEDKELLLKDLRARLQYRVVLRVNNRVIDRLVSILNYKNTSDWFVNGFNIDFLDIKPYLRPMSSMTEKEWETLRLLKGKLVECDENNEEKFYGIINEIHTFYYSCHVDCNGLIEKGLALEAPEDMYKISNE